MEDQPKERRPISSRSDAKRSGSDPDDTWKAYPVRNYRNNGQRFITFHIINHGIEKIFREWRIHKFKSFGILRTWRSL